MIFDRLSNSKQYEKLNEKFKIGFDFLKNNNLKEMKDGRYDIAEGVFANVQSLKTKNTVKTIDQMTVARQIAEKFGFKLSDILAVIEEEQKLTMEYAKMGYKVIKKNYLTIEGRKMEGKKAWKSPLTGKIYDIPAKTRILVRVGDGFKRYIENKKMPDKLCRFVDSGANTPAVANE